MKQRLTRVVRRWRRYVPLALLALIMLGLYRNGIIRPDMYFRQPYRQTVIQGQPELICYVLPAGGARQISYASAAAAVLYENQLAPDVLVGASGGAVLSALLSQGLAPQAIAEQWAELALSHFGFAPPTVAQLKAIGYFFRLHQSAEVADDLFASLSAEFAYEEIRSRGKGVVLFAANAQREPYAFYQNIAAHHIPSGLRAIAMDSQADLDFALRASSTVPLLMSARRWQGERLYDGALAEPTELEVVLRSNCFQAPDVEVLVVYIDGNTESRVVNPPGWRQTIFLQRNYSVRSNANNPVEILVVRPQFRQPLPGGDYYQEVLQIGRAAREDARSALEHLQRAPDESVKRATP